MMIGSISYGSTFFISSHPELPIADGYIVITIFLLSNFRVTSRGYSLSKEAFPFTIIEFTVPFIKFDPFLVGPTYSPFE
jgi:hypothetical protein